MPAAVIEADLFKSDFREAQGLGCSFDRGALFTACNNRSFLAFCNDFVTGPSDLRLPPHLIGGAYCSPPWVHSAFSPRLILIGEPMPTLRSNHSP